MSDEVVEQWQEPHKQTDCTSQWQSANLVSSPTTAWCEQRGTNVNLATDTNIPRSHWPTCGFSSNGIKGEAHPRDLVGTNRRHNDGLHVSIAGIKFRIVGLITGAALALGIASWYISTMP